VLADRRDHHLYAGVAGPIQFTPVGSFVVRMFDPILTAYTYPPVIAVVQHGGGDFHLMSGGQWAIQARSRRPRNSWASAPSADCSR
jgi:short subunit fatty acids transporter